ncbi:ABC transporter permease [Vibrio sp. UCD-FRSSP16_10]|uniref:ABC transporter permease n=1 Tax=unclassified Vibrio TaxID=2614977 RepID=UPI000801E0CC|nr:MULTISPECIES: FtsX-like permease family protein [unclassified Vibrio]OBT07992.1 ABC transporter permease [Vibrio sp. UCD-FRSSP16_30]OBT17166.1 ABC transporter permease [Vibrio sp. UCD-FRSSP16_10]
MSSSQVKTPSSSSSHLNRRLFAWSFKEIRFGQLWPISAALTLIIACIFALSALAERMEQVVVKQGREALTADLVFRSASPITDALQAPSLAPEVKSASMVSFSTMAFSDQDMQLLTVKAVDEAYPLRGELILNAKEGQTSHVSKNSLWLEKRAMLALDVQQGDVVSLGDADFTVNGMIEQQPGLNFNPFQQMPTAMIHSSDIEKTGALQLGSRVRYQQFFIGPESKLQALKESVELSASDSWRDQNSRSRTNDMFTRTTQYLSLTVAIVVIMAATTLVLTCQHYVASRRQTIAMLKSIGANKRWIGRWLMTQVALLFVIGAVFGLGIGYLLEVLLRIPLADLLPDPLPSYGVTPALIAVVSCLLIGVPALGIPMINLLNTSASNVLQPSTQRNGKSWWLILVPLIPMLIAYGSNTLVWIVLAGMGVLFVVLAGVAVLLSRLIGKLKLNPAMTLALSRLNRSSVASGLQFGALSLSLMLLSIVWLVRTDLLQDWQTTLPENAPNAFAINIASYEIEGYLQKLDAEKIERSQAFPIIRGRLVKVNGIDAKQVSKDNQDTDAVRRELNLTWASTLPNYNEVIEGQWGSDNGVSVESEVAEALNLKLGDQLEFLISGQAVSAVVNSIREVEWRQMKPNFYFIFSPKYAAQMPGAFMVSYRIEPQNDAMIQSLSAQYPTVSLLDIRKMGDKIQTILSQIVWSITVLAGLGVVAGLLLIFTLLRLSLSQRQLEIRLYRTLGASKKRISSTVWWEYGLMSLIAGLVASLGAEACVSGLLYWGFDLSARFHPQLWIALPVVTFIILGLVVSSLIKQLLQPVKNGAL